MLYLFTETHEGPVAPQSAHMDNGCRDLVLLNMVYLFINISSENRQYNVRVSISYLLSGNGRTVIHAVTWGLDCYVRLRASSL